MLLSFAEAVGYRLNITLISAAGRQKLQVSWLRKFTDNVAVYRSAPVAWLRELAAGKEVTIAGCASTALAPMIADTVSAITASISLPHIAEPPADRQQAGRLLVCTDPELTETLMAAPQLLEEMNIRFGQLILPTRARDPMPAVRWSQQFSFLEQSDVSTWSWIDAALPEADIMLRRPCSSATWAHAQFSLIGAGDAPRSARIQCGAIRLETELAGGTPTHIIMPVHFEQATSRISILSDAPAMVANDRKLSMAVADLRLVSLDNRELVTIGEAYRQLELAPTPDVAHLRAMLHQAGYFSVGGMRASTNGLTAPSPVSVSHGTPTEPLLNESLDGLQSAWQRGNGQITWLHAASR